MVSAALDERAALDSLESRWTRQGYHLIHEPSADQLPDFLRGFRPDAIAVGASPQLVIEVLQRQGASADSRVRQLQGLFVDRPDWRLEVVYLSQEGAPLGPVQAPDILAALGEARHLAGAAPRASLMMAWASLEATGRRLEPTLAPRSLSAGSLVDLLVSTGHVTQEDGAVLRRLGEARNAVAHGQLDLEPAPADVSRLVELTERLVA